MWLLFSCIKIKLRTLWDNIVIAIIYIHSIILCKDQNCLVIFKSMLFILLQVYNSISYNIMYVKKPSQRKVSGCITTTALRAGIRNQFRETFTKVYYCGEDYEAI